MSPPPADPGPAPPPEGEVLPRASRATDARPPAGARWRGPRAAGVLGDHVQARAEPRGRPRHQDRSPRSDVGPHDEPAGLGEARRVGRLPPRARAHVQDPLAWAHVERRHDQNGRLVLNGETALRVAGEGRGVSG